jgi:tetratricopeptide (TPR) repeat protein
MKNLHDSTLADGERMFLAPRTAAPLALHDVLDSDASVQLQRMFRDPRVLELNERKDLIAHLRQAVELAPRAPEVRVLLGMALCVDLQAQEAMEQLREAVQQAPNSFIARLKFGELLMRLRICDKAAEETRQAQMLAGNDVQAEMARKQAAAIRTMLREGIERGGYGGLLSKLFRFRRKSGQNAIEPALAASN